jgi:hypothetical protein
VAPDDRQVAPDDRQVAQMLPASYRRPDQPDPCQIGKQKQGHQVLRPIRGRPDQLQVPPDLLQMDPGRQIPTRLAPSVQGFAVLQTFVQDGQIMVGTDYQKSQAVMDDVKVRNVGKGFLLTRRELCDSCHGTSVKS